MSQMIVLPGDASPDDKIATVRTQQAMPVREQAAVALNLGVSARNWIVANEPLVAAMARLVTRLCDHVQALEEASNVPVEKRLKQMIEAESKAAIEKAQAAPTEHKQPEPQGENLIDPPPDRGDGDFRETIEAAESHARALGREVQFLTEDMTTLGRKWVKIEDADFTSTMKNRRVLKIGPKPATQYLCGAKPPAAVEQPPEKPA